MTEPRTLATGLVIGESPRWHDGRLWFAHWGAQEILAVDLDGKTEVVGRGRPGLGWSIDWLPDGRLLMTGEELTRREPDGSMVTHADLRGLADGWNEIVVDGRGNIYVNGGCDFHPGEGIAPGVIALVAPDGSVRKVADDIAFPNGMVVTPDNSTLIVAESFARRLTAFDIATDGTLSHRRVWADRPGDGICMDAEGAIWCSAMDGDKHSVVRVREGGDILQRIELDLPCFACMLGGEDGRTLFMLVADWRADEGFEDNIRRLTTEPRTGKLLSASAPAPNAGWP
ncbi:SMP-30/gluconolactonase/LRE family protein [Nonomuraea sp. 3N208]|uniref:SMP-30/gluconolactonase/LRE family protein n=1 Tax=Nonomuraea sp. 3N208 TaxID=3457421 RepID=UPI003FD364E3